MITVTEAFVRRILASEARGLSESVRRLRSAAGHPQVDTFELAGGVGAFAGRGNPLTQAASIGIERDLEPDEWSVIDRFYGERDTEFEFKIGPITPPGIQNEATRRAIRLNEHEQYLALDLTPWTPGPEAEVEIKRIGPEQFVAYAEVLGRGFYGGDVPEGLTEIVIESLKANLQGYGAWVDGELVAGGGLTLRDGIAWLHGAAVVPEFRNRGIHKALQRARLVAARTAGADLAIQGALPASVSAQNAQRQGFQPAFAIVSLVLPSPA